MRLGLGWYMMDRIFNQFLNSICNWNNVLLFIDIVKLSISKCKYGHPDCLGLCEKVHHVDKYIDKLRRLEWE